MSKTLKKPGTPKRNASPQRLARKGVHCVDGATPEESALNFANLMISPEMASFRVITNRERQELMEQLDTPALIDALRAQTKAVQKGDLRAAEAMLMNQATALQSLFVKLTETGLQASLLRQQETALRLALKAQSQCRATLETLANIKNPPIVYAKQANIAHGPQQVNNGSFESSTRTRARAGKTQSPHNELLEEPQHGSTHMDARTTPAPARSNPAMATLEPIHRPPKPRRKGSGIA